MLLILQLLVIPIASTKIIFVQLLQLLQWGNMAKLSPVQEETMEFCLKQIEEARQQNIDISKVKKKELAAAQMVLDAQRGIVYTQGGNCTICTLQALEKKGLIEVLEDNSGIGTSIGAFPSKVKVLGYE